jgi:hypothetical protein
VRGSEKECFILLVLLFLHLSGFGEKKKGFARDAKGNLHLGWCYPTCDIENEGFFFAMMRRIDDGKGMHIRV